MLATTEGFRVLFFVLAFFIKFETQNFYLLNAGISYLHCKDMICYSFIEKYCVGVCFIFVLSCDHDFANFIDNVN